MFIVPKKPLITVEGFYQVREAELAIIVTPFARTPTRSGIAWSMAAMSIAKIQSALS